MSMKGAWQKIIHDKMRRVRRVMDRARGGLLGLSCWVSPAVAAEVNIHHEGGWGPGYALQIDLEKGMMRY